MKQFAIKDPKSTKCCAGKTPRPPYNCIEHWREVAGRRIDDLEDLGGCGLLFDRLPGLRDQARVLNRDDRLRREILQQRNLFIGEGLRFGAVCTEVAEQRVALVQGHE